MDSEHITGDELLGMAASVAYEQREQILNSDMNCNVALWAF